MKGIWWLCIYFRTCLPSRFRRIFERFFVRRGEADDAKPELLLGSLDEVLAKNKPESRRNGDGKQVLRGDFMFSHIDKNDNAVMVDISGKDITNRTAVACGEISLSPTTLGAVQERRIAKGDVLAVAQVAGIMAAKRTWELVPMCHPLMLTHCAIDFEIDNDSNLIRAFCTVKTQGKTGVEMEALTGISVALLTIYDMCKSSDKAMVIKNIRLMEKTGGKEMP